MRLTPTHVPAYLELLRPSRDAEDAAERAQRVLARLQEDETLTRRVHIAQDDDGVAAAFGAHPWLPHMWQALVGWRPDAADTLPALTVSWVEDLLTLPSPPDALLARVAVERLTPAHIDALTRAGWSQEGGRVEFKTPVQELPEESGTPLVWRDLEEVGLEEAARVFALAGEGPDWEDDDDPHELIEGYLEEEGMTNTPDCVQVGYLDDAAVGFVVAQTESASGWCTLPFMGVVIEHRGKGLGQWIHRHGFAMLRGQGGELYHGGTSAENAAMLRLFERHGCRLHARLEEWKLTIK